MRVYAHRLTIFRTRVQASSARCERSTGLPNEQLLFHGTSRHCLLGESRDRTRPCTLPECSVCCIIRNSFDVKKCGQYLTSGVPTPRFTYALISFDLDRIKTQVPAVCRPSRFPLVYSSNHRCFAQVWKRHIHDCMFFKCVHH